MKDLKLLTQDHYEYAEVPQTGCSVTTGREHTKSKSEWGGHCCREVPASRERSAAVVGCSDTQCLDTQCLVQWGRQFPEQHVSTTSRHKSPFTPPKEMGNWADIGQGQETLLECAVPPAIDKSQATAVCSNDGRYEFAEVSVPLQSGESVSLSMDNEATGCPKQTLSSRYEFAQPPDQQTSLDIYSSTENLALAGSLSTEIDIHTEAERGHYNVHTPANLDPCDDHQIPNICTAMDCNDTKSYVNVDTYSRHSAEVRVHHGYSQLDLLDADIDCTNSYSHIKIAETESNRTHSRSEFRNDTSHCYSHINTTGGELISPGYFHLDTDKPETSTGTAPFSSRKRTSAKCKPGSVQTPLGNDRIATAKSYSQLDIGQSEAAHLHASIGGSKGYCQMQNTSGQAEPGRQELLWGKREPPNFRVPVITLGRSKSHLDDSEVKEVHQNTSRGYSSLDIGENQGSKGYAQQSMVTPKSHLRDSEVKEAHQETSRGYSSLNIGENQGPKGYSQLDITAIQRSTEQIAREDSCAKGYSHLDICAEDV